MGFYKLGISVNEKYVFCSVLCCVSDIVWCLFCVFGVLLVCFAAFGSGFQQLFNGISVVLCFVAFVT